MTQRPGCDVLPRVTIRSKAPLSHAAITPPSFLPPVQPYLLHLSRTTGSVQAFIAQFFFLLEEAPLHREAVTVDVQQGVGSSLGLATPTCHQRSASKPKLPISSGDPSPSCLYLPEGTMTHSPLQSALFHAAEPLHPSPTPPLSPPLLRAG